MTKVDLRKLPMDRSVDKVMSLGVTGGACYPNDASMFGQSRMPELQQLRGTFGSSV
jgi:hypothetical protein